MVRITRSTNMMRSWQPLIRNMEVSPERPQLLEQSYVLCKAVQRARGFAVDEI
jgi:hypothetical protein